MSLTTRRDMGFKWPQGHPISEMETSGCFERALEDLKKRGATVVDLPSLEYPDGVAECQLADAHYIGNVEYNVGFEKYLKNATSVPTGVYTLADLLKWNLAHPELEPKA